jgi:hypothetical protein
VKKSVDQTTEPASIGPIADYYERATAADRKATADHRTCVVACILDLAREQARLREAATFTREAAEQLMELSTIHPGLDIKIEIELAMEAFSRCADVVSRLDGQIARASL